MLRNTVYFNRAFEAFEGVDADDDRRIDLDEFKAGTAKIGMELTDVEAASEFDSMDKVKHLLRTQF